jgi:hypothetical protein
MENNMTRNERIEEMMSKKCFSDWSREDVEAELSEWSDKDVSKGYAIFDFDGTGMLEIEEIGCMDAFGGSDEKAVQKAIEDGIKIIPIEELPNNFDRKYLGWIDTEENRKAIENYCLKTA